MPAAIPIIVFIASANFATIYSNAVYNETFGRVKFARNVFRLYVCNLFVEG